MSEWFDVLGKSAADALQNLGREVMERLKPRTGPYALFHHQSHALERVKDVTIILRRLSASRSRLTSLAHRRKDLGFFEWPAGVPYSAELIEIDRENASITSEMKLDTECLYQFGAILLDQWALTAAYVAGLPTPESITFFSIVDRLDRSENLGTLTAVWGSLKGNMIWLMHQFRSYRNRFIVHADRPWQRGTVYSVFGDDFSLFTPSPPGWLDDEALEARAKSLIHLAPEWLKQQPPDYWERDRGRALLQRLFSEIGGIPRREDRELVADLARKMGLTTPTFQILGTSLLTFVASATSILRAAIAQGSSRINLGPPVAAARGYPTPP